MKTIFRRFLKAIHLASNPIYRHGLRHGVAATIEHRVALETLNLKTIIDVGANKGQFSLFAHALFPHAIIHAFEPLKGPAQCFTRMFQDKSNIILHHCALGNDGSINVIHISGREDSSSLLPILPRQSHLFPGTNEVGTQNIKVTRGDDALFGINLPKPLLIKLDVQGYEKSVLEGMPTLLAQADHVYAEISFQELYSNQVLAGELIAYLQQQGFILKAIYHLSTDKQGQPVYADALFERQVT
ncbi:FkbM family methyltransferase [Thalassospira marina]|uniref:Methyltransferase FkbM n=1 Tax=Thalassospira marina TaxID=2048283 RepID=A0ABM6QDB7_9PROT|nr:FkbM family methyltransferase [Thalassospira marina]AUG54545.1 methyltransferase FkbM [Thalassospira marina]